MRSGHVRTTKCVRIRDLVVLHTFPSTMVVFVGEQFDLEEAQALEDGALFQALIPCTAQTLHYMLLVTFYPKRLTYSILWAIPTGAIWGEVSCPGTQRHADCTGV